MSDKTHSPHLNLNSYFDDELRSHPENPDDLRKYIESEIKDAEQLDGDEKYKKLSRVAVHYGQLNELKKAHEIFSKASTQFEKSNTQMAMINFIRWADIFRFEKNFGEASLTLQRARDILNQNSFPDYEDFYFQHKGKFHFDKGEFKEALSHFEKALEIRAKKNNSELISSTELAIQRTKKKMKI